MQCLKCGRETNEKQVFCDSCQAVMDSCPVKPGTPAVIPERPKKRPSVNTVKKEKPEEQVLKLQKLVQLLCWLCLGLVLALSISVGLIVWHFSATEHGGLSIGQNYSTEAPDDAPLSR